MPKSKKKQINTKKSLTNTKQVKVTTEWWTLTEKYVIVDEHNNRINTHKLEKPEQEIVKKFIKPKDCVLELGGRYGSVSVCINNNLTNKKNHLVVEPDSRVWKALEINKLKNKCEFSIHKGFISNTNNLALTGLNKYKGGYGAYAVVNSNTKTLSKPLSYFSKFKFNVLIADCEGCLEQFIRENEQFVSKLRLIIFEADNKSRCNYKWIKHFLKNNNFKEILRGHQNIFINYK